MNVLSLPALPFVLGLLWSAKEIGRIVLRIRSAAKILVDASARTQVLLKKNSILVKLRPDSVDDHVYGHVSHPPGRGRGYFWW